MVYYPILNHYFFKFIICKNLVKKQVNIVFFNFIQNSKKNCVRVDKKILERYYFGCIK